MHFVSIFDCKGFVCFKGANLYEKVADTIVGIEESLDAQFWYTAVARRFTASFQSCPLRGPPSTTLSSNVLS